jgi:hypothetical protein
MAIRRINIPRIDMKFFFSNRLNGETDGRRFLSMLLERHPKFMPMSFGGGDPSEELFDVEDFAPALAYWRGCMWSYKRRKPRLDGLLILNDTRNHDMLDVSVFLKDITPEEILLLFREVISLFPCDFAIINPITGNEPPRPREITQPLSILVTLGLQRYLPDVTWAMLMGPPYVRLFGVDRLRDTPAAIVEPWGPEAIYLQLTTRMTDVRDDWPAFEVAQSAAKKHLNCDAFYDPAKGPMHHYRVPEFHLQPISS